MIRDNPMFKNSSFLSVEKDTKLIVEKILKNKDLQKLLYYNTKDCLTQPDLNSTELGSLFANQIFTKFGIPYNPEIKNYLIVSLDKFLPNSENPEYRDNSLELSIVCSKDTWSLGDFRQRPMRIAGEIDKILNNSRLTGIGRLNFNFGATVPINEDLCAFVLTYDTIHGSDDRVE